MTYTSFCSKPSLLVRRLAGKHIQSAGIKECQTIGKFLAAQHKAMSELKNSMPNYYSVEWMSSALSKIEIRLSKTDYALLRETIDIYSYLKSQGLPTGLIHGDLFRDNALFNNDKLTGVIDYYRACEDLLAIDIAIAINDWCREEEKFNNGKRDAIIDGYNEIRSLTETELLHMIDLQQVSASRFTLTRMLGGDPPLKNPEEMLLLARSFNKTRQ